MVLESGVDYADGSFFEFGWVDAGGLFCCFFRCWWVEGVTRTQDISDSPGHLRIEQGARGEVAVGGGMGCW